MQQERSGEDEDPLVAIRFLQDFLADRAAGQTLPLDAYRSRFPGHESVIEREYAALAGSAVDRDASIGRFRLIRELGRGGQGRVWLAHDSSLGDRLVALKTIPLARLGSVAAALRFRREMRIASQLDLAGVCPIFDAGEDGEVAWIAMRYVPGRTLAQWIAERRRSARQEELAEILRVVEDLARTVHAVHRRGIVHRDLKPANLMVDDEGRAIVLDFGLARAPDGDPTLTFSGDAIGTPAYMAPEQVRGELDRLGPQVDVWGLAVVLYELLAARRAFEGPTSESVQRAVLESSPPDLRRVCPIATRDLAVVLETALHKDLTRRYASAEAFADELARVRRGEPVLARPMGRVARAGRWFARRPALALALVALVFVLGVGLAVTLALNEELRRESLARERATRVVETLSDGARLEALNQATQTGLPMRAASRAALADWVTAADALLARRERHEALLADLRALALPVPAHAAVDPATRERREHELEYFRRGVAKLELQLDAARAAADPRAVAGLESSLADTRAMLQQRVDHRDDRTVFAFADPELQWMHERVAETVRSLAAFAERRPGDPTLLRGRVRLYAANRIAASAEGLAGAWRELQARFTAPASPYAGLRLDPQDGLAPLGPDPQSGLEEFAVLETGETPVRAADGRLGFGAASAVVLVLLPAGRSPIGVDREPGQGEAEVPGAATPRHVVELAPYFVGKHEITRDQYLRVTMRRPSIWNAIQPPLDGGGATGLHPVDLTWVDARFFCDVLGLELPTESQWEHACRAGSEGAWHCGGAAAGLAAFANLADRALAARDPEARVEAEVEDGFAGPAPIGSFAPNAFGLYDLHGNLREWCRDHPGSYDVPAHGPEARREAGWLGSRAVRGGSFRTRSGPARSWYRDHAPPAQQRDDIGFRVVRAVETIPR